MADRLYVFTSREIIEAVLRTVPAPPWDEIDSAEFKPAENGGVVTLYLKPIPALVDLMAFREPSPDLARLFKDRGGQPASPTTLPLMDVQDDPPECPDPIHELLAQTADPTPEAFPYGQGETAEALYQSLRARLDEPTPTVAQLRAWSQPERDAVARWVAIEHAHDHPIAGMRLPPRMAPPESLVLAIEERKAELVRLGSPDPNLGKPAKKKRGGKS
jgi:hypothetical protein